MNQKPVPVIFGEMGVIIHMKTNILLNNIRIKATLLLLLSLLLCGCPSAIPGESCYYINNNSDECIAVYFATGSHEFGRTAYPDTLLPPDYKMRSRMLSEHLLVSEVYPHTRSSSDPVLYDDGYLGEVLPRDTFSIIILNSDTLRKYGYEDVRRNNRILVRYDLSSYEARYVLKYEFPFPPKPIMRDMKMTPSYFKWEEASKDITSSVSYVVKNFRKVPASVNLEAGVEYRVHSQGGVSQWITSQDNTLVTLHHNDYLENAHEWTYSAPQSHVPLWEKIKYIYLGEELYPKEKWNNLLDWNKASESTGYNNIVHIHYMYVIY